MELLPKSDTLFFPFSEGAVLFNQDTRRLTVLNQNAAVIWCLLNEVDNREDLASALKKNFSLHADKAAADVDAAVKYFLDNDLLQVGSETLSNDKATEDVTDHPPGQVKEIPTVSYSSKEVFRLPALILEIRSQDKEVGIMVDQVLGYLKDESQIAPEIRLSVHSSPAEANCHDIYQDQTLIFATIEKSSVMPHVLQLIFDLSCKALNRYFLFHAAVITNNSRAVLFPAHVGSGKTTLAAGLAKQGCHLFSDELAVINVETLQVMPFPMPMSIKPGSVKTLSSYYPELESLTVHFRPDGKSVRYLPPPHESMVPTNSSAAVKTLIFPHYQPGAGSRIDLLSKEETLKRLARTCSSDRTLRVQDIRAMLAVVEESQGFVLEFHELENAIKLIRDHAFHDIRTR